jgi:uncharacterized protein (DUF1697 family)
MNLKMPELKRCLEEAGFANVRTLLSSGNAVFNARVASDEAIAKRAEKAMLDGLGRSFLTIVRPVDALAEMLALDPYAAFRVPKNAKRVVTFLREAPTAKLALPISSEGAAIYCVRGREIYSAYVPGPKGPVFMTLIEKTYGKDVTTRTWDTVRKVASG